MSSSTFRRAFGKQKSTPLVDDLPAMPFVKPAYADRGRTNGTEKRLLTRSKSKPKIKKSDISLVLPSAGDAKPLSQSYSGDYREDGQFLRSDSPPLIIDKKLLDQFPMPPVHAYALPMSQQFKAEQRAIRRQPLARSSSVSSYSRPTAIAYSALFQDNASSTSSLPSSRVRYQPTHSAHSQSLSSRSNPHLMYATGVPAPAHQKLRSSRERQKIKLQTDT
ncbi:hypothetical protein BDP27DRAFT_1418781 [Rhodocollybia butyracea]|uniref:Uncharacterized protein n=1 Tax=Rhodocollybia butyracea TaxID=206335 RepID=A0A9P5UB25_9AGAR|nr:hypothetical protein BDP27DRAFT_1418781 [Rhodocollybia butyracea]